MSELAYRMPVLPWTDTEEQGLFRKILWALLVVMLVAGYVIPNIQLPEIKREKLEKVPPQLAKVIQQKKLEVKPKPVVVPKVEEKKPEPVKPEVIKKEEAPKPAPVVAAPKPAPVVAPPAPKPAPVAKAERSPERVKAAKEKAKKMMSAFSGDLADMRSSLDMGAIDVSSSRLSNAGSATTNVGSVVSQEAASRVGGISEGSLTRTTGGENVALADRQVTKVKEVSKESFADKPANDKKVAGLARTEMQVRRVFEQNQSRYDRVFRKALRDNPLLQGTVIFNIKVAESGAVADCSVKKSELKDADTESRLAKVCQLMNFSEANKADTFEYAMTFAP
jgi:periplasmic protein TonB